MSDLSTELEREDWVLASIRALLAPSEPGKAFFPGPSWACHGLLRDHLRGAPGNENWSKEDDDHLARIMRRLWLAGKIEHVPVDGPEAALERRVDAIEAAMDGISREPDFFSDWFSAAIVPGSYVYGGLRPITPRSARKADGG